MPINKNSREWNGGEPTFVAPELFTWKTNLLRFLQSNRNKAYHVHELVEELDWTEAPQFDISNYAETKTHSSILPVIKDFLSIEIRKKIDKQVVETVNQAILRMLATEALRQLVSEEKVVAKEVKRAPNIQAHTYYAYAETPQ